LLYKIRLKNTLYKAQCFSRCTTVEVAKTPYTKSVQVVLKRLPKHMNAYFGEQARRIKSNPWI